MSETKKSIDNTGEREFGEACYITDPMTSSFSITEVNHSQKQKNSRAQEHIDRQASRQQLMRTYCISNSDLEEAAEPRLFDIDDVNSDCAIFSKIPTFRCVRENPNDVQQRNNKNGRKRNGESVSTTDRGGGWW
jgi:hypothetical protein